MGNRFTWPTQLACPSKKTFYPKMFYTYSMENNFSNEKVIAPVRKNRSPKKKFLPKNFLHSKKTHFSNKRFFMSVSMNRLPKKSNFYPKISYTCPKENNFLNGITRKNSFTNKDFLILTRKVKAPHFRCVLDTALLFFMLAKIIRALTKTSVTIYLWSSFIFRYFVIYFFLYPRNLFFPSSGRFL